MPITKGQGLTISVFIGLFFVLYLGCDTTSKEYRMLEKSRILEPQFLNEDQEKQKALALLPKEARVELESLNVDLEQSHEEQDIIEIKKKLASRWYAAGNPLISGIYAKEIAETQKTDESWGIAGSTFYLAMQNVTQENEKKYCQQSALKAFENAISINPSQADYKINRALCYVEMPPEENPMKGILMLMDLEEEFPEESSVQMQLGRLGLRTNQLDNAIGRFEKVLKMEPNNPEAHCYLLEIYSQMNVKEKIAFHSERCKTN